MPVLSFPLLKRLDLKPRILDCLPTFEQREALKALSLVPLAIDTAKQGNEPLRSVGLVSQSGEQLLPVEKTNGLVFKLSIAVKFCVKLGFLLKDLDVFFEFSF